MGCCASDEKEREDPKKKTGGDRDKDAESEDFTNLQNEKTTANQRKVPIAVASGAENGSTVAPKVDSKEQPEGVKNSQQANHNAEVPPDDEQPSLGSAATSQQPGRGGGAAGGNSGLTAQYAQSAVFMPKGMINPSPNVGGKQPPRPFMRGAQPDSLQKTEEELEKERMEREAVRKELGAPVKGFGGEALETVDMPDEEGAWDANDDKPLDGEEDAIIAEPFSAAMSPPSPGTDRGNEGRKAEEDESIPTKEWFDSRGVQPPVVTWYQTPTHVHVIISPASEDVAYQLDEEYKLRYHDDRGEALRKAKEAEEKARQVRDGESPDKDGSASAAPYSEGPKEKPHRVTLFLFGKVMNPEFKVISSAAEGGELVMRFEKKQRKYWTQIIHGPLKQYNEISWIRRDRQRDVDSDDENDG